MKSPIYTAYRHVVYDPDNWHHYWIGWEDGLMSALPFSKVIPQEKQLRAKARELGTPVIFRVKH